MGYADGVEFVKWYVKSGNVKLTDETNIDRCTFVMPDGPVEIGMETKS